MDDVEQSVLVAHFSPVVPELRRIGCSQRGWLSYWIPARFVETRNLISMQIRLKSLHSPAYSAVDVPSAIIGSSKNLVEALLNLASNAVTSTKGEWVCVAVNLERQTTAQSRNLVSRSAISA